MQKEYKRLTISVSPEQRLKLMRLAAEKGMCMSHFIIDVLSKKLDSLLPLDSDGNSIEKKKKDT